MEICLLLKIFNYFFENSFIVIMSISEIYVIFVKFVYFFSKMIDMCLFKIQLLLDFMMWEFKDININLKLSDSFLIQLIRIIVIWRKSSRLLNLYWGIFLIILEKVWNKRSLFFKLFRNISCQMRIICRTWKKLLINV